MPVVCLLGVNTVSGLQTYLGMQSANCRFKCRQLAAIPQVERGWNPHLSRRMINPVVLCMITRPDVGKNATRAAELHLNQVLIDRHTDTQGVYA